MFGEKKKKTFSEKKHALGMFLGMFWAGSGWLLLTLASSGWFCLALAGSCCPWLALDGSAVSG